MARIAGVVIPDDKQVQVSLTYIYGIGPKFARDILAAAKIEPTTRVKDLTEAEEQKLRDVYKRQGVKISHKLLIKFKTQRRKSMFIFLKEHES